MTTIQLPVLGETRMFAGQYAPAYHWKLCEGAELKVSEYPALAALLGTAYGGDGGDTFTLPDLRGRLPVHKGTGSGLTEKTLGESGGVAEVGLTEEQVPVHTHKLYSRGNGPWSGNKTEPGGAFPSYSQLSMYTSPPPNVAMSGASTTTVGGDAHSNLMPYTCINFIIAVNGASPAQSPLDLKHQPFIGEIGMLPYTFTPENWLPCDGRALDGTDAKYSQLFEVIGTFYGGEGTTFHLPDLRGRAAMSYGEFSSATSYALGDAGGTPTVTLDEDQVPSHNHVLQANSDADTTNSPSASIFNVSYNSIKPDQSYAYYDEISEIVSLNDRAFGPAEGGGLPHENRQPFLALPFCIAVDGIFPM